MRRAIVPLALGVAALGLLAVACTPPGPPDRPLAARTGDPEFLGVSPRSMAASSEPGRTGDVRIFAACREGLFASDDLGYTFHRLRSAPANIRDVATSMFDGGTVVIASPNVRVSQDRGETFAPKGLSARLVA